MTIKFNGANAQVDGLCESSVGFGPVRDDKPEIDTGRSASARARSFVGSSTVETHVHASLGALSEATIYGVNAQADAHRGHALAHVTRPFGGLLTSMPEISTGHPTLSRSQSASNNSLPVGGLAPTLVLAE